MQTTPTGLIQAARTRTMALLYKLWTKSSGAQVELLRRLNGMTVMSTMLCNGSSISLQTRGKLNLYKVGR